MILKVVVLLFCSFCLTGAEEGDPCDHNGASGTCINIKNCPSAIADLSKKKNPKICSFAGTDPVVCCVGSAPKPKPPPKASTTARPTTKATTKPPQKYDDEDDYEDDKCEDIPVSLTSNKTGQKAWDMCVEYQQSLVYPCKRSVSLIGGMTRQYLCHHNADDLIVGGDPAAIHEFPHMALLGYGTDEKAIEWQCGGSLVSDQWILTAGHCTYNRNYGVVTFTRVGALKRSDPYGDKLRRVERYENAPGYVQTTRYNDVALIKMDRKVLLDQFLVPACLHIGDQVAEDRVLAAGWGLTEHKGSVADNLQKVILNRFNEQECSDAFPPGDRHMLWGVEDTQMCYGDKEKSKDTCQGDSGGPIMIKSKKLHCMYVITGVTSFGKRCGKVGDPAIYTRVASFLGWLERTVWP